MLDDEERWHTTRTHSGTKGAASAKESKLIPAMILEVENNILMT